MREIGLYRRGGKRVLDVTIAAPALVVLSPLLLLISLAVWLEDRGPVLFRQRRVGRQGRGFTLLKFRSMPVGTADLPSHSAGGLRVTRVGRVIRRLNLDELPQLINVLWGEMSIVGPRPALPSQDDLLRLREGNSSHSCRPGLTGLAQIHAFDGMTVVEKAIWDDRYGANIGLLLDVSLIVRTFRYLVRRPPVY